MHASLLFARQWCSSRGAAAWEEVKRISKLNFPKSTRDTIKLSALFYPILFYFLNASLRGNYELLNYNVSLWMLLAWFNEELFERPEADSQGCMLEVSLAYYLGAAALNIHLLREDAAAVFEKTLFILYYRAGRIFNPLKNRCNPAVFTIDLLAYFLYFMGGFPGNIYSGVVKVKRLMVSIIFRLG